MKKSIFLIISLVLLVSSCNTFTRVQKTTNYDYKYEAAKQYFAEGKYEFASLLLDEQIAMRKGSDKGEESLYMFAMCNFKSRDYLNASLLFKRYYESYPRGVYAEEARYISGLSLYEGTLDPRLSQAATYNAITEFQNFLDYYPNTKLKKKTQDMIFALQDLLIEKEYLSAKLYYDLGDYFGNCTNGGSNYQACIVTAKNALKDYPYSTRKEDFAILVLQAKLGLAQQSIDNKRIARFRDTIDEYYAFVNDFPESKHLKEARRIFSIAEKKIHI